jgi:carboxymethylenebutenolidase
MHTKADLGAVFDEHLRDEFELHDPEATMQTMVDEPHLYHVPTMSGGNGRDEVFEYYRDHFIRQWPRDTSVKRISRTADGDQVVDEIVVSFTHDVVMDTLLPGIAPTGKHVSLPTVVVVKFDDGKIAHEHIYWDQASLLAQVGLIDVSALPVTGVDQAKAILEETFASNPLLTR